MFKLTDKEKWALLFLIGMILLGSAVRQWRAHHDQRAATATTDLRKP